MNQESIEKIKELEELSKAVSVRLWDMYMLRNCPDRPHLIFPEYSNGEVRISEQESKILFANILEQSHRFYSVETPTVKKYTQKGDTPESARTDISLYKNSDRSSKRVNIELKAKNPDQESFRKDLEKLLREELDGLWFHTLKNTDAGTLPNIYEKIRQSFGDLKQHLKGKDRFILFAFCVLKKKELFFKFVSINGSENENLSEIETVFA